MRDCSATRAEAGHAQTVAAIAGTSAANVSICICCLCTYRMLQYTGYDSVDVDANVHGYVDHQQKILPLSNKISFNNLFHVYFTNNADILH